MLEAETKGDELPRSEIEQKVQQPVTLIWRDLIYSVTYKKKQIKESHLKNEQHDDQAAVEENRLTQRSVSNSSQMDKDDIMEIKNNKEARAPLLEKKRASSRNLNKLASNARRNLFASTIFIDPNIPKHQIDKTMPVLK